MEDGHILFEKNCKKNFFKAHISSRKIITNYRKTIISCFHQSLYQFFSSFQFKGKILEIFFLIFFLGLSLTKTYFYQIKDNVN